MKCENALEIPKFCLQMNPSLVLHKMMEQGLAGAMDPFAVSGHNQVDAKNSKQLPSHKDYDKRHYGLGHLTGGQQHDRFDVDWNHCKQKQGEDPAIMGVEFDDKKYISDHVEMENLHIIIRQTKSILHLENLSRLQRLNLENPVDYNRECERHYEDMQ